MLQKGKVFIKESQQELKRINWPSRRETVRLTLIVIIMSLTMALFLGVIDFLLSYAVRIVI